MDIERYVKNWFEKRELKRLGTKLEPNYLCWNDNKEHYLSHLEPVRTIELVLKQHFGEQYGKTIRVNGINAIIVDDVLIVTLVTVRPGLIIGFRGKDFEEIKRKLESVFHLNLEINIKEDNSFYFYEECF